MLFINIFIFSISVNGHDFAHYISPYKNLFLNSKYLKPTDNNFRTYYKRIFQNHP